MTVSTPGNRITYLTDGSNRTFTFPFPYVDAQSIHVFLTNQIGTVFELATNQYGLVLNPPIDPNPTGAGGTVTYPLSDPPLDPGFKITIVRQLEAVQNVSLTNQSIIYPPVVEREFDYLTMLLQGGVDSFDRAFKVSVGDPLPADVPPVAVRKNQAAFFDANGDLTSGQVPGGTVFISSVMIPVVGASSLATARALLGLGQLATLGVGLGLEVDGTALRRNAPIRQVTTNQNPTSGNHDTTDITSGTLTYSLSPSSGFFNGFGFYINVNSGSVTLVPSGADHIQGLNSGVNWAIPAGSSVHVSTDAAGVWYLRFFKAPVPTSTTLAAAGSGNYIPGLGVFRIRVQMCGGGAGGGFGGGTGINGGAGGNTTFGGWTALGGVAGQGSVAGSGGGPAPGASGGGDGTGNLIIRVPGGDGEPGLAWISPAEPNMVPSGRGGGSYFGDGGASASNGQNPFSGRAYGAGGGGGANGGGGTGTGGGGSGGEYVSFWRSITSSSPIAYVVGAGGAGQGPSLGRNGVIVVEEFYGGP